MHIVKIEETFCCDIHDIWTLMTDLNHQTWRSQIDHIEILTYQRFIEYDKSGFQTEFTILNKIENEVYEFNMKNENIEGHWIGKLKVLENGQVHLEMTEAIQVKNKFMNVFAKSYLKKQQKLYMSDLKKALEKRNA